MASQSTFDSLHMRRALSIARCGSGQVQSNPLVGAVLARGPEVLAEGFHPAWGSPHAERFALKHASLLGRNLNDTTLYVTLEPCCHHGKTPPCTEAILATPIPRVVIATEDPNPLVAGQGAKALREAGKEVVVGVEMAQAVWQNAPFFTYHQLHRPYVTLKWAQSSDGYIDAVREPAQRAVRFTGRTSNALVHKWRAQHMAILVGANTVLSDNPRLTVRHWVGYSPARITYDRDLSLPTDFHFFDGEVPTLLFTTQEMHSSPKARELARIPRMQVIPCMPHVPVEVTILQELHRRGIVSLFVEGGAKTLERFMGLNLWDEARVFISPRYLKGGVKAPSFPLHQLALQPSGRCALGILRNRAPQGE